MSIPRLFAVTISRQVGSGGASVGRKVASELGIAYADRSILERATIVLDACAEDVEAAEEKAPSFLRRLLESYAIVPDPGHYLRPPNYADVRDTEASVIREIAGQVSSVIVGRAGFHVLAAHTRHMSVFIHADVPYRVKRVAERSKISEAQAIHLVQESDKARGRFLEEITGRPWTDALQYAVSVCTSVLGEDLAVQAICDLVKARFGSDLRAAPT